jgi:hypothetical protein
MDILAPLSSLSISIALNKVSWKQMLPWRITCRRFPGDFSLEIHLSGSKEGRIGQRVKLTCSVTATEQLLQEIQGWDGPIICTSVTHWLVLPEEWGINLGKMGPCYGVESSEMNMAVSIQQPAFFPNIINP